MLTATQCLGFPLWEYTAAEIYQMWSERMRQDWQHTSCLAAYLIEVNRGKKGKPTDPDHLNPMESTSQQTTGIPLNSELGFQTLKAVAEQWQNRG